jgi:hypothetical protein
MRIISTCSDVESLSVSDVFPYSYMDYLKEEFLGLFNLLNGDGSLVSFSLQTSGYTMVILEQGDRNIFPLGLESGLVNSNPEYVEVVGLGKIKIYRIGIMLDNDSMLVIYSEIGNLDSETEKWLVEQSSISERGQLHGE